MIGLMNPFGFRRLKIRITHVVKKYIEAIEFRSLNSVQVEYIKIILTVKKQPNVLRITIGKVYII